MIFSAEQNRTEQNRTEQNKTEQNRAEQNRTDWKLPVVNGNLLEKRKNINFLYDSPKGITQQCILESPV
jgi:hypothetical protein